MGLAADATGIQFRMLNRSKGPAVQSPRAQADRWRYADWMRQALEQTENLTIVEALAAEIITENNNVRAVGCKDGSVYRTSSVVLTPGTFLGGMMYIGNEKYIAGILSGRMHLINPIKRHPHHFAGKVHMDCKPC